MSTTEKTPLVSGTEGNFYFLNRGSSQVREERDEREAGVGPGAQKCSARGSDSPFQMGEGLAAPNALVEQEVEVKDTPGTKNGGWPHFPRMPKMCTPRWEESKLRKVPIKVEPKVFFSNERTFIAWMHMAVTLSTIAIAIVSFAKGNPWSQVYGLVLLPVAIFFIVYALLQYMKRARMIRHREPGPYEDTVGPLVLALLLMGAIVMNFGVKLYDMYSRQ